MKHNSASQRETGQRDALRSMLVTALTSHDDRSELKEEARSNTARERRWLRVKEQTLGKPKGG